MKKVTLFVETSEDGRTRFTEIADILENLATAYQHDEHVYCFLLTRALEARQADRVYEVVAQPWSG